MLYNVLVIHFQLFPRGSQEEKTYQSGSCCKVRKKEESCCRNICRRILSLDIARYINSAALCALLVAWPLQNRLTIELNRLDAKSLADVLSLRQQIEQISNACKNDMSYAF
ncbi:unnamed protein product [Gongylonema pulchrum]|uniref:Uncharacterized protein n=1 Tax=Gongylonema pulchrum TaxID=637853 RepID=A0A183DPR1_9BILA|nr:unnamed protein product [Gongylonema pulchrum]